MDNCNIQFYKDGNDIILVFKNADKEIKEIVNQLVSSVVGNMAEQTIKSIPAIEPLPNEKLLTPNINDCENVIPDFLKDEYGSDLDDLETEHNNIEQENAESEKVEQESSEIVNEKITNTETVEQTNKEPAVLDNPLTENVKEEVTVLDNIAENVFTSGKYKNMTPQNVVDTFGHNGFYILCSALYKNVFRTNLLRDETNSVVKEYLAKNNNALGEIKDIKKNELIEILTSCTLICKSIIDAAVQSSKCNNSEEYYKKTNEFALRAVCWKCISEIRRFVKGLK